MTGFEPANGGVTIHCLTTWLHPPENQNTIGADSGNRTRTSCLEGKGTTIMQYPRILSSYIIIISMSIDLF